MIASDPGLLRLMLALRGTISVFLTTTIVLLLADRLHVQPTEFATGVVFSMVVPFLSREPTARQRQRTVLMLIVPAAVTTLVTTMVHSRGLLGEAYFLVLVFTCTLLQPRNSRGVGVGLIAVIISYVGLYLELPASTLPVQLLSLGMALPTVWLSCFVLVPVCPAATLQRTVQAVQRRAALVLRSARELDGGHPDEIWALRQRLSRLNEAALAADDQLSLLYPNGSAALRHHLMDLELAAARLVILSPDMLAGAAGERQRTRFRLHERRLNRARWLRQPRRPPRRADMAATGALAEIAHAAAALAAAGLEPPIKPVVADAPAGPLAWRMAIRVTVASAAAMAGGMAVSPQRWFWAVLAAYIIFLNTRSRGDAIFRGVQRVSGTFLGLLGGLLVAASLSGIPTAEVAALVAAVFGMYYFVLSSYTLGIFCVTLLLGLIYSLLGVAMGPLLVLRLEETTIGAAAAILTALFIVPVRTRDQVGKSGVAVLRALAQAVATCRRALAGETDASPLPDMRNVDRQVADLRLALAPLTVGRSFLWHGEIDRSVPALLDCVHWTRVLSVNVHSPDPAAAVQADTLARTLAALASGETTVETSAPAANPSSNSVAGALQQLTRATADLSERLAISAVHGFRLDG